MGLTASIFKGRVALEKRLRSMQYIRQLLNPVFSDRNFVLGIKKIYCIKMGTLAEVRVNG